MPSSKTVSRLSSAVQQQSRLLRGWDNELCSRVVSQCDSNDLLYRGRWRNYLEVTALFWWRKIVDQTDIWMLGVGAFGVVFYLLALHFHRTGDYQHHHGKEKSE